jgi:thiamine biosynthesis lipoprotein
VELSVRSVSESSARRLEAVIIEEMARLERVFTLFDDSSELVRWQRGEADAGPELSEVLSLALHWQRSSRGVFNPMVGRLWELWASAGARGQLPSPRGVAAAARAIGAPAYRVEGDAVHAVGEVDAINLNAIARGWIIDRAARLADDYPEVDAVTLNAGGDLLHRGTQAVVFGIEDPLHPYDHLPPLVQVEISDGALATSGGSRRGFEIAGRQYSDVFDPRTGYPADHVASASAIAQDATTADVVATVLTVLPPAEGLAYVDTLDSVACCVVANDGSIHRTKAWAEAELG